MEEETKTTEPVEQEETKPVEEPVEQEETFVENPPKNPELNCLDCKGEGLNEDQTARCVACGGTGKVYYASLYRRSITRSKTKWTKHSKECGF